MTADIFVSYSRTDRQQVQEITSRLREQGASVWIDLEGISAATRWSAEIVHALEQCRMLLLMVSPASIESTYVRQEVLLAAESGKALLPLYLAPVRLPPEFRLHFAGIQILDLASLGVEGTAREVLRALKRLDDLPAESTGTPPLLLGGHGQPFTSELPRGTVTIVFTDIEGSSDLWESRRHELLPLYERHNELVRGQLSTYRGVEVKTTGDGFMLAFDRAVDAIDFGCALQSVLAEEDWSRFGLGVDTLKVRVGIHTGEVILAEETGEFDYYGPVPNRAARVCGAANGAQVLVSQSTWSLAGPEIEGRLFTRDLGPRLLKGVGEGRLWQISAEPLGALTLETRPAHRSAKLPTAATTFVGREEELERWGARIRERKNRVFSLVGAGGSGKSRLALQLAHLLASEFSDGAVWVELVEAVDPLGMWQRIADALGVEATPQRPFADQVKAYLADRDLLLVLDNTEQIQRDGKDLSGAVLKELVQATAKVTLLVVTRRAPALAGQQRLEVEPLSPVDAFHLFVERARTVRDDFTAEGPHETAVRELCRRLEFIPLAIELAAARVDLLAPRELLKRLERGLGVLKSEDEDVPDRFRTLRATIEWSHQLLAPEARKCLSQLAAFSGGFSSPAVAAVCGDEAEAEHLVTLIRHSLVSSQLNADAEEARFRILEAVREFAIERLQTDPELEQATRRLHAEYFLRCGEQLTSELTTPAEAHGLHGLYREFDNLKSALRWAKEYGAPGVCARLARAIYQSTFPRGFWNEAEAALEIGLASIAGDASQAAHRASLLFLRACLEREGGHLSTSQAYAEEALAIQRASGDKLAACKTLNLLCALQLSAGKLDEALDLLDQMELLVEPNDPVWQSAILHNRACIADLKGETDQAWDLNERALRWRRTGNLKSGIAYSLCNLGALALKRGDALQAVGRYQEGLRIRLELEDRLGAAILLFNLAEAAEQGDAAPAAVALYREAERQFREMQSVYASAASEALFRMEQARSSDSWSEAVATAASRSWEDWAWSL